MIWITKRKPTNVLQKKKRIEKSIYKNGNWSKNFMAKAFRILSIPILVWFDILSKIRIFFEDSVCILYHINIKFYFLNSIAQHVIFFCRLSNFLILSESVRVCVCVCLLSFFGCVRNFFDLFSCLQRCFR